MQVRIGHFAEAQILQHLGVDMIDESEVLAPADDEHHIDKTTGFQVLPLYIRGSDMKARGPGSPNFESIETSVGLTRFASVILD